ncbi:acyltransferase family protein [Flavobacterium crassostreae]|uniref:acyltransferase family protein n=1 Tax=Flavobacterium crassostreae TaxID=1763534 RepID=UPI003CE4A95B
MVELITFIIIIGQIKVENRVVNLENKAMSYLGKLSFGIYVYHPLIILVLSRFLTINEIYSSNELIYTFGIFILTILFTLLVSHLSYYKFEKNFLKLKHKFSVIKSTNDISDVH